MSKVYTVVLYPEGVEEELEVFDYTRPGVWLLKKDNPEDARRWQLETIDHDQKRATARIIDPLIVEANKKVVK